jgi:hypothetical protein
MGTAGAYSGYDRQVVNVCLIRLDSELGLRTPPTKPDAEAEAGAEPEADAGAGAAACGGFGV